MLFKIPAAFIAGLKVESVTNEAASVSVRSKWVNKNPFRSIYFAVLFMTTEMSKCILCMAALYKRKPAVSMLIVKIEGSFFKKATGKITFTCNDGIIANQAVERALATGEGTTINCTSTGVNEQGEIIASFFCTWSFKTKTHT